MKGRKSRGPEFVRYFGPVIQALKDNDASARPGEVCEWIIENLKVSEAELSKTNKNGRSNFENKVAFARFYLAKAGYIDGSKRGVWALTEKGRRTTIDQATALEIFKDVQSKWGRSGRVDQGEEDASSEQEALVLVDEETDPTEILNRDEVERQVVQALSTMTPKGFEEFCARVFRVLGFDNVNISGGSGDAGIDGVGELLVNRFLRTRVAFQCKKYQDSNAVTPEKVRDFRGAISGRVDRGIFLTTSRFTRAAIEEARRENTVPIELVDLNGLVSIVIEERIGLQERLALRFDPQFFSQYSR